MNNDLISRSDLLNVKPEFLNEKVVRDTKYQTTKNRIYAKAWNDCNSCWIDTIDNAPTVDLWQLRQEATENALKKAEVLYARPQGEWIPVSERLPEENGVYLVTLEYIEDSEIVNEIDMARFIYSEKDDYNNGFHKSYIVTAWQPLPEPYMGGKEE